MKKKEKEDEQVNIFAPILRIDRWEKTRQDVRELSKLILILLAAGVVITSVLVTPGASGAVAKLMSSLTKVRWRRRRLVKRLQRLKYIRINQRDGRAILVLTPAGQKVAKRTSFDLLEIKRSLHWDQRWRIIVFDIPERKRLVRDILRAKIKQLGFREFQQSVWTLPWPCRKEIEFTIELYGLSQYLSFWEVPDGPEFFQLRKKFDL